MGKIFTPAFSVMSYGPSPGSHLHDYFQILWSLNGSLELEIEGKGTNLRAGTGIVIAPNERHDFESHDANRCLVLNTADSNWAGRQRLPHSLQAIDHLARFISEAISAQLPISLEISTQLLAQTWGNATAPTRARRQIEWLQLMQWAKDRLANSLTVVDLAERVCLSESQFRARCYAEVGCSPLHWLREIRREHACVLRARGMSVADVARRVGYDSPSAMTAAMRKGK